MNEQAKAGKVQLLMLIGISMGIQCFIAWKFYYEFGDEKLFKHTFRIAVLGMLWFLTYVKIRFTKWLLVAWFVFNAILGVDQPSFYQNIGLIGMALVYIAIPFILLFSKEINEYFGSK